MAAILVGDTLYFSAEDGSSGKELWAHQPGEITSLSSGSGSGSGAAQAAAQAAAHRVPRPLLMRTTRCLLDIPTPVPSLTTAT